MVTSRQPAANKEPQSKKPLSRPASPAFKTAFGDLALPFIPGTALPSSLDPAGVLSLQRVVGNRAVTRLLEAQKPRLPMAPTPFRIQRLCARCEQATRTGGSLCPECERRQSTSMGSVNKEQKHLQLRRLPSNIHTSTFSNRDNTYKFNTANGNRPGQMPALTIANYSVNKDFGLPADGLVQRNFLSDAWQGVTEAGPAVAQAMRTVSTLISNPSLLPAVLSAIAWEQIPERFKGPIIDQILQVCLTLARNVEIPSPPGMPIGTILKHVAIGFLERALRYPTGMKVRVANRISQIVLAPSSDFSLGFLKGLVLGLWDGLTGPFVLLWDLIKVATEIQMAQIRFISRMFNQQARNQLSQELQAALDRIGGRLAAVVGQLLGGKENPLAILHLIENMVNVALRQVESLGSSLADALLRLMNKPDRQLGESLGWLGGTLTFEVLLLVLTDGGYTILKEGLQSLRVVVRLAEVGGQAWEALGPVRAALSGFRAFARSNRALAPLLEAVEEVFSLLIRFLRFSYGAGGPGGAAGRTAEHGAGAAERGATREIRVANTATRETHEITLLADGRLIRCSDRCVQLAESIIERSGQLERAGLQAEGSHLTSEARQISEEARALKANTALSDAERTAQEGTLLNRAEALERQMAAAEQQFMERLRGSAEESIQATRRIMRESAGNPRLRQFEGEVTRLEQEVTRNRELASETLDPEMRRLVEQEFQNLERQARELEERMRREVPALAVATTGRQYVPSPKHEPGGWGTLMDLDNATAQRVLDNGILGPNGRQVYGYHNGRLYEFQPDNVGGFHGYPIPGTEAPPAVLRQLRDQGIISDAEYRRLLRGA